MKKILVLTLATITLVLGVNITPAYAAGPSSASSITVMAPGGTAEYGEAVTFLVIDKFTDRPDLTLSCTQPSTGTWWVINQNTNVGGGSVTLTMVADAGKTWLPEDGACHVEVGHIKNRSLGIDARADFVLHNA